MQGFIDGIGPLATMPRFLSQLGVKVLRSVPLRQVANQMAYHDRRRYATDDAMRVGRLHTNLPGWTDANVAFMQVGWAGWGGWQGWAPDPHSSRQAGKRVATACWAMRVPCLAVGRLCDQLSHQGRAAAHAGGVGPQR